MNLSVRTIPGYHTEFWVVRSTYRAGIVVDSTYELGPFETWEDAFTASMNAWWELYHPHVKIFSLGVRGMLVPDGEIAVTAGQEREILD